VWTCDISPVIWRIQALVPTMLIVDSGVGMLAHPLPQAPPARARDFDIAPQPCFPKLLPPARGAATGTRAFRRQISGSRLTRDFLRYPNAPQEPRDNGMAHAIHPMRRRLYHGRPYGSYFDPWMGPELFDVHQLTNLHG
jgi:hypothetical protein